MRKAVANQWKKKLKSQEQLNKGVKITFKALYFLLDAYDSFKRANS